jgi:hypothetical protein
MNTTDDESTIDDLALALALRRLDETSVVPPPDAAREAALMAAFDSHRLASLAQGRQRLAMRGRRDFLGMAGLAAAAALLIAVGMGSTPGSQETRPALSQRSESRGQPGEFVMVPGAIALPEIESGSLVRMDLPVSVLPALGVMPPAGAVASVRADVILGQDGLPRAVRLVN